MELLNLQGKSEIIEYLNKIDELCSDSENPLKPSKELFESLKNTIAWIDKNFNSIEINITIQLLEFLLYFNKTKDFNLIFNDYRFSFLINNNLAYLIQQSWKYNMGARSYPNYKYIQDSISIIKEQRSELEKENENQFFELLKFDFTLTKSFLQLAASFSHLKDHKRALSCGKKCLYFLNSLLKNIEILLNSKKHNLSFKFKNFAKIQQALQNNKDLKNAFFTFFNDCKKINNFCGKFLDQILNPEKNSLSSDDFKDFESIVIKMIEKKLNPKWINKLSIINFMHIEYVYLDRLNLKITFEEIFSEGFLSILISISCVIYFMISTENRFHLVINNKFQNDKNFKIKSVFEKNHFEKLKKMKNYVFSEFLHSKTISILQNYFYENSLLTHFTNSFLKNYQANLKLENIPEVEDSLLNSSMKNETQTIFEYSFDLSNCQANQKAIPEKSKFSILNTKVFENNSSENSDMDERDNLDVIQNNIQLKTSLVVDENIKKKNSLINNLINIFEPEKKQSKKLLDENERITIKKYKKKIFDESRNIKPSSTINIDKIKSEKSLDIFQNSSNKIKKNSKVQREDKESKNFKKNIRFKNTEILRESQKFDISQLQEKINNNKKRDNLKKEKKLKKESQIYLEGEIKKVTNTKIQNIKFRNKIMNKEKIKNKDFSILNKNSINFTDLQNPKKIRNLLPSKNASTNKKTSENNYKFQISSRMILRTRDDFLKKNSQNNSYCANIRENSHQPCSLNNKDYHQKSINTIDKISSTITKKNIKRRIKKDIIKMNSTSIDIHQDQGLKTKLLFSKIFKNLK